MEKTRKYIRIAIALLIIVFSLNLLINFIKFDNKKTNARILVVLSSLILAERLKNNSKNRLWSTRRRKRFYQLNVEKIYGNTTRVN